MVIWMKMMTLIICLFQVANIKAEIIYAAQLVGMGANFPKNSNEDWVRTQGALTSVGMRQLYLLGRETRKRYGEDASLLPEIYNALKYKIYSVNLESTLEISSAYAFLRGLYLAGAGNILTAFQQQRAVPPREDEDIHKYQKELREAALPYYFSSVPVMMIGGGADYILGAKKYCSNLEYIERNYIETNSDVSQKIAKKEEKYREGIYKELTEQFDIPVNSMEKALELYDYMLSAKFFDHSIKQKISERGLKQLEEMYLLKHYKLGLGDELGARVISNGFLTALNQTLNKITAGKSHTQVETLLVSDINIMAFLRLFNVPAKQARALYASSLNIEVYSGSELTVKLFKNGQEIPLGQRKSLNEFRKYISSRLISNFHDSCIRDPTLDKVYGVPWVASIVLAVTFVLIIIAIFCVIRIRKVDKEKASSLLNPEEPTEEINIPS